MAKRATVALGSRHTPATQRATIHRTGAGCRAAVRYAPPSAGPAPAIVLGARRATITRASRSASGTRRATIRQAGTGGRAARARRYHPIAARMALSAAGTGELRRAAHLHSPAVLFGARRNTNHRLLPLRADGRSLSKSWTVLFEWLESTFERNVEQKYTTGI